MGARPSGGGGGIDIVFNHRLDLYLRIMERLGDMTGAAHSENIRIPLAADGKEICLRFLSEVDCIRSYTCSYSPVRGHNREAVIRFISVGREFMDPSRNRKFNCGGDQGSHRVHWESSRGNGTRNSERQNHGNGAIFVGGRGGHSGGRDGNNCGGGSLLGGNGNNTNPPPHQ